MELVEGKPIDEYCDEGKLGTAARLDLFHPPKGRLDETLPALYGSRSTSGHQTEAWEIIYFKLYKSQIPVIEQAIETAALMLRADKSRKRRINLIA